MNFHGIKGHKQQLNYLDALGRGDIPHAILFSGRSGTGKRSIAERFIKSLYCGSENPPCLECETCRQIAAGSFPDYILLERDDKGKIPVGLRDKPAQGTVRWLIERISRAPVTGRYCVLIDGVHTISESGQNALLKTIEEPYSNTIIVMISDGRSGILPTILSRCVNITFNPLADGDVAAVLAEHGVRGESPGLITAMCGGALDCAFRLTDERVIKHVLDFAESLSVAIKSGNMNHVFLTDKQQDVDDEFLLDVLINTYSSMLRGVLRGAESVFPAGVLVDREQAVKLVKILLAIKKGQNNNLNFRTIMKGMLYSEGAIDASLNVDPDFAWL